jgi:hypothetical protein
MERALISRFLPGEVTMAGSAGQAKHFILVSDFDQTLSFNDSGAVLSELIGVNNRDGFTIAVSENKLLARIARSTVLSDSAFSISVPILEQLLRWRPPAIHELFESYGLTLRDWEKARTDRVTVQRPRGATEDAA